MKSTLIIMLAFVPFLSLAATGRVERVGFDLRAPSRQIAVSATEGLDTTIEASIRSDGALFDVRPWACLLWYGDGATNPPLGLAFTNSAAGRGWATWDLPGALLATNGRFTVQIVAHHTDGSEQEWARGFMTIQRNLASTFTPVSFGSPMHTVSNALAASIQAEAVLRAAGDAAGSNYTSAVRSALLSSNAQARAAILAEALLRAAGDNAAKTNHAGAVAAEAALRIAGDAAALAALATNRVTRLSGADTWVETANGTTTQYTAVIDTNRLYIVSTSSNFNGPPAGSVFARTNSLGEGVYFLRVGSETDYVQIEGDSTLLTSQGDVDIYEHHGGAFAVPMSLAALSAPAVGSCVVDYVPTTNAASMVTTPTVVKLADQIAANTDAIAAGDTKYLSSTPGWFWQGSQATPTNAYAVATNGYAVYRNSRYELVPYTTTRHDVTGSVTIASANYIVAVNADWYVALPSDLSKPTRPMFTTSSRSGPTSWVLRAWCSTSPADFSADYYAYASNVVVLTYDRQEMRTGAYTNDAAGIVSRVDDAPANDPRRAVNRGTMAAYVDSRKTEIADKAWRRTPAGRDAPSAYTVTIDQPLVQQGQISYLNSGDYYCISYAGGDWYSSPTGSTWRIGPSGTVAFEIQATNRMLHVQGFTVAGGYATLDISTNWVHGTYAPDIEFTADLVNPQWLACPQQTMTNMIGYWRGTCPATVPKRYYRVVLRDGAAIIKSHYTHEFGSAIILFGQRYSSLVELKTALEALP